MKCTTDVLVYYDMHERTAWKARGVVKSWSIVYIIIWNTTYACNYVHVVFVVVYV